MRNPLGKGTTICFQLPSHHVGGVIRGQALAAATDKSKEGDLGIGKLNDVIGIYMIRWRMGTRDGARDGARNV